MTGYFIIYTNINNRKGHTLNILKTIEGRRLAGEDIRLLCPRYSIEDLEEVMEMYTVTSDIPIVQLWTPFSRPSKIAFIFFTLVVGCWLCWGRMKQTYAYVYIRSEYFYPLIYLLAVLRRPYFYEIHRIGLRKEAQRIKETIAKRAAGIVVLTDILKEQFSSQNIHSIVAHDAADFEHYQSECTPAEARQQLGLPVDCPIAMYTGSVQKIKGIDFLLEAAVSLPQVMFYVVGRVEADMYMMMQTLPPNVVSTGAYTQAEAPLYLQAADVLLLPHPEGPQSQSPMKLFEYMAVGKPIVSSDLAHIREVLPAENFWFAPGDLASFTVAVESALEASTSTITLRNQTQAQKYTYATRGSAIASFVRGQLDLRSTK